MQKHKCKTKVCAVCDNRKPVEQFYLLTHGYHHSYCKPCMSEHNRKYYNKVVKKRNAKRT